MANRRLVLLYVALFVIFTRGHVKAETFSTILSSTGKVMLEKTPVKNVQMIKYHRYETSIYPGDYIALANIINGVNIGYQIKYHNRDLTLDEIRSHKSKGLPITVNETDIKRYLKNQLWKKGEYDVSKGFNIISLMKFAESLGLDIMQTIVCRGSCLAIMKTKFFCKLNRVYPLSFFTFIHKINRFRNDAIAAIGSYKSQHFEGIVIILCPPLLGFDHASNFGVLAAYHKPTDTFLVLNANMPSLWISTKTLWKNMKQKHKSCIQRRGYLKLYLR